MKRNGAARTLSLRGPEPISKAGLRDLHLHGFHIDISPNERHQFGPAEARTSGQQNHSLISNRQLRQKRAKLRWGKNVLLAESDGRCSHLAEWVESNPLVTNGMAVKDREDALDLRLRSRCKLE